MFAGHVGAALAIGRVERRINAGAFVFAALLLDVVLWLFVLLGWESVVIPPNFTATHQPEFIFPYSHGLLAAIMWSALAGTVGFIACTKLGIPRLRAAVLLAAAVFSHWLLDALVHVAELPLMGADSGKVGLGLWQNMPFALLAEALILIGGLYLFLPGAAMSRTRKLWLSVMCVLILAFTLAGMTIAPPPPSSVAMAATSLITIIVSGALVDWLSWASGKGQRRDHGEQMRHQTKGNATDKSN
jgi:hypothetical protein